MMQRMQGRHSLLSIKLQESLTNDRYGGISARAQRLRRRTAHSGMFRSQHRAEHLHGHLWKRFSGVQMAETMDQQCGTGGASIPQYLQDGRECIRCTLDHHSLSVWTLISDEKSVRA